MITRAVVVAIKGKLDNGNPRDHSKQTETMPKAYQELCKRLAASHYNQLETLGYFAAGVAVAVAMRVPESTLASLTGWYVKSRIAYNITYALPQYANGVPRSMAFLGAMTSVGMLYAAAANTAISTY